MPDEAQITGVGGNLPANTPQTIGDRKLKPSTMMMGHGFDPALSEGALKPPIFLTSTFVFPNAAAGKRHFEGVTGKRPGRRRRPRLFALQRAEPEILEDRLAIWDEAEDALLPFRRHVGDRDAVPRDDQAGRHDRPFGPLYAATETLIGRILGKFGVKWLDFPAGATREEIDAVLTEAATGNVALIYLESPANRPTRWSISRRWRRAATRSSPMRRKSRRSRSTTLPGAAVAAAAAPRGGYRGLQPHQICRRP